MLDAAEGVGVVQRKGAWYSYGDTRLGQGREKTLAILEDDAALAQCALPHAAFRARACILFSVTLLAACVTRPRWTPQLGSPCVPHLLRAVSRGASIMSCHIQHLRGMLGAWLV